MSQFPINYYKIDITLVSPLSVGSGENVYTDHDIILDSRSLPRIPATALCGVLRSFFEPKSANALFGELNGNQSAIRVYDAQCTSENAESFISVRDSVKLQKKVAVEGAKFDAQVVNHGVEFTAFAELLDVSFDAQLMAAFAAMNSGLLRFGQKTTRGYDQVALKVYKKEIKTVEDYLAFEMFTDEAWKGIDSESLDKGAATQFQLNVALDIKGGISIREYSTEVGMPDYSMLTLKGTDEQRRKAVIPGTSWAGAFRTRFTELVGPEEARALFGDVYQTKDEKGNKVTVALKSKIIFGESELEDGEFKNITRNAIDRFSAGTREGALYTERTHYFGSTHLCITLDAGVSDTALKALAICLWDLHHGFLAVGGLTAVGRGVFEIRNVFGKDKELTDCVIGKSPQTDAFVKLVKGDEENDA